MTLLNNPPQPVPTPIRNHVAYEDRVAVLLNRAGSSRQNPLVGSRKALSSTATTYSETTGAVLRMKFAMATTAESITSAVAQEIDDDGVVLGDSINLNSYFVADTTNMIFYSDLTVGTHLQSGSETKRIRVKITTNLNRYIDQQVFTKDAPTNMVTAKGQVTTQENPLLYLVTGTIDGTTTYEVPVSFFPSWNDEIARQHGATGVSLTGNIAKPYGGMSTVELYNFSSEGGPLGTLFLAETSIEDVSSISVTPTTNNYVLQLVCRFRSKQASTDSVLGFLYVRFEECGASSATADNPPVVSTGSGGSSIVDDGVVIDVDDLGTDSNGDTNTSVSIVATGYTGGIANSAGTAKEIANVTSGSATFSVTTTGPQSLTLPVGDLRNAELVIFEVKNSSGTVLGNSLVYTTSDTDTGLVPSPPTISGTPAFSYTKSQVSITISDFGWPDTDATIYCYPIYGGIENPAQAQEYRNVFANKGSSGATTGVMPYTASVPSTDNSMEMSFSGGLPSAVVIWAANSYGSSSAVTISDDGKVDGSVVKSAPVLGTVSLTTVGSTNDTISLALTSVGDQATSFTAKYVVLRANGATATTGSSSISSNTSTQTVSLPAVDRNQNAWYVVNVTGDQGTSNTVTVSNVSG